MSYYNKFRVEDHPFEDCIPNGAKYLVIGTFPTHERNYKSTFRFYYAGDGNQFWSVMKGVFGRTFQFEEGDSATEERKKFLTDHSIGITDMLKKCYRQKELSQDHNLFPILLNDIFALLEKYSTIETIVLTSRTKVIGALGLFETYFYQRNLKPPELTLNVNNILEGSFTFASRDIEVLVPYSTSRTVIEERRATLSELTTMYRCCFT